MVNPTFDAGIFLTLVVVGFACLAMAKQRGSALLLISVVCFSVIGSLILTGNDVSSFTIQYDSSGLATNQTTYFIGNGIAPNGTGQLSMGWIFITFAILAGAMFLNALTDGTSKLL